MSSKHSESSRFGPKSSCCCGCFDSLICYFNKPPSPPAKTSSSSTSAPTTTTEDSTITVVKDLKSQSDGGGGGGGLNPFEADNAVTMSSVSKADDDLSSNNPFNELDDNNKNSNTALLQPSSSQNTTAAVREDESETSRLVKATPASAPSYDACVAAPSLPAVVLKETTSDRSSEKQVSSDENKKVVEQESGIIAKLDDSQRQNSGASANNKKGWSPLARAIAQKYNITSSKSPTTASSDTDGERPTSSSAIHNRASARPSSSGNEGSNTKKYRSALQQLLAERYGVVVTGQQPRSVSSDAVHKASSPPTSSKSKAAASSSGGGSASNMLRAAHERTDKVSRLEEVTSRLSVSGYEFGSLAKQIAEREKNKKWYQL